MTARKFSITQGVAVFFICLGLVITTVCGYGLYRLRQIDVEFDRSRLQAAQQELAGAIADLQHYVRQQSGIIAKWSEIRQQLVNPHSHGYLKAARLQQADIIPPVFSSLELFDSTGRALPGGNTNRETRQL